MPHDDVLSLPNAPEITTPDGSRLPSERSLNYYAQILTYALLVTAGQLDDPTAASGPMPS